jgi:hypothetical protein
MDLINEGEHSSCSPSFILVISLFWFRLSARRFHHHCISLQLIGRSFSSFDVSLQLPLVSPVMLGADLFPTIYVKTERPATSGGIFYF